VRSIGRCACAVNPLMVLASNPPASSPRPHTCLHPLTLLTRVALGLQVGKPVVERILKFDRCSTFPKVTMKEKSDLMGRFVDLRRFYDRITTWATVGGNACLLCIPTNSISTNHYNPSRKLTTKSMFHPQNYMCCVLSGTTCTLLSFRAPSAPPGRRLTIGHTLQPYVGWWLYSKCQGLAHELAHEMAAKVVSRET
jgi:hypothetical protein